jgi:hypothetical protein
MDLIYTISKAGILLTNPRTHFSIWPYIDLLFAYLSAIKITQNHMPIIIIIFWLVSRNDPLTMIQYCIFALDFSEGPLWWTIWPKQKLHSESRIHTKLIYIYIHDVFHGFFATDVIKWGLSNYEFISQNSYRPNIHIIVIRFSL